MSNKLDIILAEISAGELIDKMTILEIKKIKITDKDKTNEINKKDLLNDPKEIAEHLMLIDLGRNDVGKVSEIGTVTVSYTHLTLPTKA